MTIPVRTLIDIPQPELDELNALGEREQRSRASMVREAIASYLVQNRPQAGTAFGLWGQHKASGLAYQKKVRAEW